MKFNVKLRAEKDGKHISGAEKIVDYENINRAIECLLERTKSRFTFEPSFINIKINAIKNEIMIVDVLTRIPGEDKNIVEGREKLECILKNLGYDAKKILGIFYSLKNMRGAVMLDVDTYERLENDQTRGVRVSCFDYLEESFDIIKRPIREAKCLSSKVASCPNIVGEICVTDDVNFTHGYFASKTLGFLGISHIKELNEEWGGRIFLFDSKIGKGTREQKLKSCIDYLENAPVLIKRQSR